MTHIYIQRERERELCSETEGCPNRLVLSGGAKKKDMSGDQCPPSVQSCASEAFQWSLTLICVQISPHPHLPGHRQPPPSLQTATLSDWFMYHGQTKTISCSVIHKRLETARRSEAKSWEINEWKGTRFLTDEKGQPVCDMRGWTQTRGQPDLKSGEGDSRRFTPRQSVLILWRA